MICESVLRQFSESFNIVVGSCQGVLTWLWGVVREF